VIDYDADVFPMVGPGQSYAGMITGPFIPSRSKREAGGKGAGRQAAADMF
jgi:acetolactate synthase-1/2/3 large subunit